MEENRERKRNAITIRMDDSGKETLDYLSDRMNRSKSDTIIRACKFFSNVDNNHAKSDGGVVEKARKNHYIHMRVSDTDMELINNGSNEAGGSISKYVRDAIKAYYSSVTDI